MTDIINTVMLSLGSLTVTSGILIALALVADKLLLKKYSSLCRYAVWTIIILRMCIPLSFDGIPALLELKVPESLTFFNLESSEQNNTTLDGGGTVGDEINNDSYVGENIQGTTIPSQDGNTGNVTPDNKADADVSINGLVGVTVPVTDNAADGAITLNTDTVLKWAFVIWLSVAAVIFTVRIVGYLVYSRKVQRNIYPADPALSTRMQDIATHLGIRPGGDCALYMGNRESPMLIGFIKPKIIIPEMDCDDVMIGRILSHELIHYGRRDLWVKLACVAATSLHWFNPLVYLASAYCNRSMELSCDERALEGLGADERNSYSRSMLAVINMSRTAHSALTTRFDPKRSAIVERFANILEDKKKKRGVVIIAVALVLCIVSSCVVFGITAAPSDESPDSETDSATADTEEAESESVESVDTAEGTEEPLETESTAEETEEPLETEDTSEETEEPLETEAITEESSEAPETEETAVDTEGSSYEEYIEAPDETVDTAPITSTPETDTTPIYTELPETDPPATQTEEHTTELEPMGEPFDINLWAEYTYIEKFSEGFSNSLPCVENTYSVIRINTKTDFDQFIMDIKSTSGILSGEDSSVVRAISQYDDAFFENNSVLVSYYESISGSFTFEVEDITWENGKFIINVIQTNNPQMIDCMIQPYFISVAVPDRLIESCTEFGAYVSFNY